MPFQPLNIPGFREKHAVFIEDKEVNMPPRRRASTASIQHTMFWTSKRIGLVAIVVMLTVGAAIGAGVGVALHKVSQKSRYNGGGIQRNSTSSTPSTSNTPNNSTSNTTSSNTGASSSSSIWSPQPGLTWNMQFIDTPDTNTFYDVWDIDLFDTSVSTISTLQAKGSKVICYFSGGSYENWRSDASNFQPADLGLDMSGWPGEKWINVASDNVRAIMLKRLDLAVSKGCDGVDPDNMDAYNNKNGLGLTQQDAIDYVTFLSQAAHSRNLAISLKNAGEIVPSVVDLVQYSVNEACAQYSECKIWQAFINAGKPVFHVEYPKGSSTNNMKNVIGNLFTKSCSASGLSGFSTIIKNQNLNSFIQLC